MATHNRLLGKCVQVDHQPIRRLFVESYRMPNPDSLPTVSPAAPLVTAQGCSADEPNTFAFVFLGGLNLPR
jgi:hypothetical protein